MFDFLGPLKPLAPALVISSYFIVLFAAFAVRQVLWGRVEDQDVNKRSASPILNRYLRHYLMWVLRPYERALIRLGVSPNAITFASLLTAGAAGWALATGRFALGGWLYLFTGILDIFDGRIARATNTVSAGGAFFDSVMDRYSEILVFGGLAYFYRDSWAFFLAIAAMLGSVMVSYTRARAEGLNIRDVNIGTMQRPERLAYLGMITALAPIFEVFVGHGRFPMFVPTVAALGLLAFSANITAVRRILHTMRALETVAPPIKIIVETATPLPVAAAATPRREPRVLPLRAAANR